MAGPTATEPGQGLSAAEVLELVDQGSSADAAKRGQLLLEAALGEDAPQHLESVGLGSLDLWVLDLRWRTHGDELPARVSCPACGMQLNARVERTRLELPAPDPAKAGARTVEVKVGDAVVTARTPDGETLLAAAAEPDVAAARRCLIERCVVEARAAGGELEPLDLPDETLEAVGEALVEADPGVEIRVALTCAGCAHEWAPVLDPVLFFWRELSASAVQILDDVHQLAMGYGWSEAEVLKLSARRRRRYVERLSGA